MKCEWHGIRVAINALPVSYFEIVFSVVFNFFKLYGQFATF